MNGADSRYVEQLVKIFNRKNDIIRFIWSGRNDGNSSLFGNEYLPSHNGNPFEYILGCGVVDEEFLPAYEIYCSQAEMMFSNASDRDEMSLELKMDVFGRGSEFVILQTLFLRDDSGKVLSAAGNITPMPDEKLRAREMLECFTMDRNPRILQKRIYKLIDRIQSEDTGQQIAFVQFDIERFKLVNEAHGSEVGDKVLSYISDVLDILCGNEKPHGRLSSDLFSFIMPFYDRNEIIDFIRLVESRIVGFMGLELRLCFGVYIMRDHDEIDPRRCGDNAGMARFPVKGNALANIGFYDDKILHNLQRRQEIEDDMHSALVSNEFLMYLQPKVCISTGKIISAEALARWHHHSKGMISPGEFIPVFEKDGFIIKLDRFIWEEACRQIKSWIDAGIPPVPISVNVSRAYLDTADVVSEIYALVKKYGIPIEYLQLEITESAEASGVDEVVDKFKHKGFTMLMDDFGSGYSSLNMLKTTKFDVLKIDRSFFSEFMESTRGRKIIEHTISMSKDIGLDIIAEGVETSDQALFLNKCGCDAAQGFLYSKPITKEQFDTLMKQGGFGTDILK